MGDEIYLHLNKAALKKLEKVATEEADTQFGSEDCGKHLLFSEEAVLKGITFDTHDGNLLISGEISQRGEGIGFISLTVKLDIDTVTDIVSMYLKQLGRLKTVLEALKNE